MKTSGNPTILGSENNNSIEYKRNNCYDQSDYTITKLDIQDYILTIYQNPRNIKKVKFTSLENFDLKYNELNKNKVEKTFNIETTDGLQGSGNLTGSKITLSIKSANPHIYVDQDGIYIRKFTDVNTSGTVPSTTFKDEEHFLTSQGTWIELNKLEYKGEINKSTGFPNIEDLKIGMLYRISDLGDPNEEIKDESTNQTFKSEDLILWDGNKWILLGHASVKVNLSTDITDSYISINNSAGNGVVLPSATSTQAGLFSASDKSQFNTYKGISSLGDIITIDSGVSISYTEKVLLTGKETPRTLIFPAATDTINGVLLSTDKIKLNNLPEIISRSNIEYDGKDLCLINTEKNINTGLDSTDKIQLPIASYDTSNNYKSGLITGENTQKLENIESMITGINYAYEVDALKITYSKYNSNTRTSEDLGFILPIASNQTNGLLSRDDKIKLDKLVVMEQKQSDWKIEDPDDISFIKNKPSVLTSTSSESSLIPSTLNITDKQVKFLNANGEWVDSTLSKPIITISPTEPTDENLKIDGAIWIQIPVEGD